MRDELHIEILEVLVRHKVVPETIFRNEKIKMEYEKMKRDGIKPKEAKAFLAEKYFISGKSLDTILYTKKND